MIRITALTAPAWITVADGLRLYCQPVTSLVMSQAKLAVARLDISAADDDALRIARFDLLCRELARIVITDWEGVGDADGQPIAVDALRIDALMNLKTVLDTFTARVVVPAFAMAAEKKDLAPLPDGTTAGVPNTAAVAPASANDAPTS
jgi:hypothetical protein